MKVTGTWRRDGSRNLIVVAEDGDMATTRYVISDDALTIATGAEVTLPDEDHVVIGDVLYEVGAFEERQRVWTLTKVE